MNWKIRRLTPASSLIGLALGLISLPLCPDALSAVVPEAYLNNRRKSAGASLTGRGPVKNGLNGEHERQAMRDLNTMDQYIDELRSRNLLLPIEETDPEDWKNSFFAKRSHGTHRAADMMAPRNTPIRAVEDGTIARLHYNGKGGITIYQTDPSENFVYYYAHLEKYADGLKTGDCVKRGQIIGYVGTTGNAPPGSPHLHFQICKIENPRRVWNGVAINPYDVFIGKGELTLRESHHYDRI